MGLSRISTKLSVLIACLICFAVAVVALALTLFAPSELLRPGSSKVSIVWEIVSWEQDGTYGPCALGNGSFSGSVASQEISGVLEESCNSNIVEGTGSLDGRRFTLTVSVPTGNESYEHSMTKTFMRATGSVGDRPLAATVYYANVHRQYELAGTLGSQHLSGTFHFHEIANYSSGDLAGMVDIEGCSFIC